MTAPDPSLWVGADGRNYTPRMEAAAKRACWTCPVQRECLLVALLAARPTKGVYGAFTLKERRALITEHDGDAYSAVLASALYREVPDAT